MRICYYPATFDAAGCYRCLFPARELEKRGHECFVELDGDDLVLHPDAVPDADVYVIQQRNEPEFLEVVKELQKTGRKVVFETDDYTLGISPHNPAFAGTHPSRGKNNRNVQHALMAAADCVTVSTPFLQRQFSRFNANVVLLPNYLERSMWEDLPERNWERVRIGWMGDSTWRTGDLQVLRGVIGPFLRRHPEVDFVAAGSPDTHEILEVPEGQRVSYPKVSFQSLELAQITGVMDVGLVPMEQIPFNEGKSALKGMEYAACGIPCIATPTESYREWVDEGENGFLARRAKDWLRWLELLVSEPDTRRQMGDAARQKVPWIDDHAHLWEDLYQRLCGDEADALARAACGSSAIQKPGELAALFRSLKGRKLRTVVEIGSAHGGMFHALALLAEPDALLVSIDLPFGDFSGADAEEFKGADRYGRTDTPVETMRGYLREGQEGAFLRGDSQKAETREALEEILQGREIDLLFIDGDHSYEGVKRDYELYSPLARTVAFHDIVHHAHEPRAQVDRLWAELKKEHSTEEFFVHDRSWGKHPWGGIGIINPKERDAYQDQEEQVA